MHGESLCHKLGKVNYERVLWYRRNQNNWEWDLKGRYQEEKHESIKPKTRLRLRPRSNKYKFLSYYCQK